MGCDRKLAMYLNDNMICLFKLYLLPLLLHLNLVCINFNCTPMYGEVNVNFCVIYGVYVESCMILVVCWRLIETLRGTRRTTGFIWA